MNGKQLSESANLDRSPYSATSSSGGWRAGGLWNCRCLGLPPESLTSQARVMPRNLRFSQALEVTLRQANHGIMVWETLAETMKSIPGLRIWRPALSCGNVLYPWKKVIWPFHQLSILPLIVSGFPFVNRRRVRAIQTDDERVEWPHMNRSKTLSEEQNDRSFTCENKFVWHTTEWALATFAGINSSSEENLCLCKRYQHSLLSEPTSACDDFRLDSGPLILPRLPR